MTDAHYLVALEDTERKVRKEEEQNNLVRKVAREIAGSELSIIELMDTTKYCKSARVDIRRLLSLGFEVELNSITKQKIYGDTIYVSEWVVTLP